MMVYRVRGVYVNALYKSTFTDIYIRTDDQRNE